MLHFEIPSEPHHLDGNTIAELCQDPGFGSYFTDHMVVIDWTAEAGWQNARVSPYGPLAMDPASAVYHYAQEVFEGLKAYRHADGSVWLFRPERNAARFFDSARRLALPELPVEDFVASVRALVEVDECWTPSGEEQSLYLRPFMMAAENYFGVRPARTAIYVVIASPVGSYFSGGVSPVDIWISTEFSRVANGGTGAAKCGGNYAASLIAQEVAYQQGCSQVLFTDNAEHRWIEELGGMNFFMVTSNNEVVTPELNGNILPGVTRDSLLQIAPDLDLVPVERRISLDEVIQGVNDGFVTELFACGTAAVITPIRSLKDDNGEYVLAPVADSRALVLRQRLLDIQYGRVADSHDWMQQVTGPKA